MNKSIIQNALDKTILGHWAKFIVDVDQIDTFFPEGTGSYSVYKVLNQYFVQKGFLAIGKKWQEISYHNAYECLSYCIANSIVYAKQLSSEVQANELAHDFVSEFPKGKFFANFKPQAWQPKFVLGEDWSSMGCEEYMDPLGWQFEYGLAIIAFDEQHIGIFCKLECD